MSDVLQDLRYAARGLRTTPGFTTVAVLTLTLGIGANTAIFSILNSVILQPLDYPRPERLMHLTTRFPEFPSFWVSPPEYLEFQQLNRSFSAIGAYRTGEVSLTGGDRPMRVRAAYVDDHLLDAVGVAPMYGRRFARGETDVIGGRLPAVGILSYELWQRAYGGQPIVGQAIEVSGRRGEVIGIMPPGFDVMDNRTDIWLPLGLNRTQPQNRGAHFLYLIGRLKEGVTVQAAQAELNELLRTWRERAGLASGTHLFTPLNQENGHVLQMTRLQEAVIGGAGRAIWVLQIAVAVVLLIACANLANLLFARAETRRREFAVRTALGGSWIRLLRQFTTEGLLLSLAGGALGLSVAYVAVRVLVRAYPATLPRTAEISLDPFVLLVTFTVATGTGIIFGLVPLLYARGSRPIVALRDVTAKAGTDAARHYVRGALVIGEVACAVMLAVGATLLTRTVYNLTNVDAGFDRSGLITFSITLPPATYPRANARMQTFQRLLADLRRVPGVQAVTAMSGLPPDRPVDANGTDIENYTNEKGQAFEVVDYYQNAMSDYFETMGIPIVEGRTFQPADSASPGMVAIVNETLAERIWKGQSAIGQRLRPRPGNQNAWFTVIGVAKDVKQRGVDEEPGTEFYRFIEQTATASQMPFAPTELNVVLRTGMPIATTRSTIERIVQRVDRTVPIVRLREMEDVFAESIERPRLLAQLIGAFAGLALMLAAIGTYGVLSFMAEKRRREIGIRVALGAGRTGVVGLLMKQGLQLTIVGVIIGLAGASVANRLITSLLFGIQPTDPMTFVAVISTILILAAVACGLPAWRAARVDSLVALKYE